MRKRKRRRREVEKKKPNTGKRGFRMEWIKMKRGGQTEGGGWCGVYGVSWLAAI